MSAEGVGATPRKIGNIRLGERVATGGMGTVFLGYDQKLQRQVAVKAIRRDRLAAETRQRFLTEARILSRLDHPCICRIHDYLEDGDEGFLVLEWIEGRNLRAAISDHDLPARRRLEIAESVAAALVAAHGQGIVHRDLKPANVMLPASGEVKVLDFGLARPSEDPPPASGRDAGARALPRAPAGAARPPEAAASRDTYWLPSIDGPSERGRLIGTPAHMSPEQARGEPATAASDMYSFGLLLQELLTGRSPYPPGLEPDLLLVKAGQGDTLEAVGVDAEVARLISELKALAPTARPTAADARERLRRIRQRPARRRRQLLAAALVLALFAGVLGHNVELRHERNQALAARSEAEAVVSFLVDTFGASGPWDRTPDLDLRDVLDRGAERIRFELRGQPAVRARLLLALGNAYWNVGLHTEARALLQEAREVQEGLFPEDSPEIAATLMALALVAPEIEESEALYRRSLEILEAAPSGDARTLGSALHGLAALYRYHGDYARSRPLFERALAYKSSSAFPDPDGLSLAMTQFTFAELLLDLGELESAEVLLQRSLATRERVLAPGSPRIALTLKTLGRLHYLRGDLPRALELWQRTLGLFETGLGLEHPEAIAILNDLALAYMELGEPAEAIPLYRRAVESYRRVRGSQHRDTAIALNNLAGVLRYTGQLEEAEALYGEAFEILSETLGPENVLAGIVLARRAELEKTRGRTSVAEPLARRSLAILESALGDGHARVGGLQLLLAELALDRGESASAEALFRQALEASRARIEKDDRRAKERVHQATALLGLGNIAIRRGALEEATVHHRAALEVTEPAAATSRDVELRNVRALALLALGRVAEARPLVSGLLAFGWSDPRLLAAAEAHGLVD